MKIPVVAVLCNQSLIVDPSDGDHPVRESSRRCRGITPSRGGRPVPLTFDGEQRSVRLPGQHCSFYNVRRQPDRGPDVSPARSGGPHPRSARPGNAAHLVRRVDGISVQTRALQADQPSRGWPPTFRADQGKDITTTQSEHTPSGLGNACLALSRHRRVLADSPFQHAELQRALRRRYVLSGSGATNRRRSAHSLPISAPACAALFRGRGRRETDQSSPEQNIRTSGLGFVPQGKS
jgi:hypothetical protein